MGELIEAVLDIELFGPFSSGALLGAALAFGAARQFAPLVAERVQEWLGRDPDELQDIFARADQLHARRGRGHASNGEAAASGIATGPQHPAVAG